MHLRGLFKKFVAHLRMSRDTRAIECSRILQVKIRNLARTQFSELFAALAHPQDASEKHLQRQYDIL